jgi:hypothetical protein
MPSLLLLLAAIRQALAKAVVAFYQKCEWELTAHASRPRLPARGPCSLATLVVLLSAWPLADVDEQSKQQIKAALLSYDRTLLVADPRRMEPKKCVWEGRCDNVWQQVHAGAKQRARELQRSQGVPAHVQRACGSAAESVLCGRVVVVTSWG